MADQVKWPVCHPMLCQVLDCHTGSPIHARWLSPSNGCVIPDAIADELNRLATIDACAELIGRITKIERRVSETETLGYSVRKYASGDSPNYDLVHLHARLTEETARD